MLPDDIPKPKNNSSDNERSNVTRLIVPGDTHNETLDTESRYSRVNLLQFLDDGHLMKRLSEQVANETCLPVNTVFIIGLAVFCAIAARRWAVLYKNGKRLPIGLYVVAEQPSGTGKTRCMNIFQTPFYDIQFDLLSEHAKRICDLEKKTDLKDAEAEELLELKNRENSVKASMYITNTTPEGLENTLHKTKGCFSAVSSEQGLFNSLLGYSYNQIANNNDITLAGFEGGHVNSLRITRNGYSGHVVGGIACFAQQGSIETVLDASHGTGLSERFLMLAEPHPLGTRDHTKTAFFDSSIVREYERLCQFFAKVLKYPKAFKDLRGLVISDNGHQLMAEYRNQIEPHLADGGKYSHISLRGAAAKIDMQIMKIAAGLHLTANEDPQPQIDDRYLKSAIGIANELLEANLMLCREKSIIGLKAEYTSILQLFEDNQQQRTERNIIQAKVRTKPFCDFTGNKSEQVRAALAEMVNQRLLIKMVTQDGLSVYVLGQ